MQSMPCALVNNVNEELHPKQRTAVGAVADVSDAEHNRAFLEHDTHSDEVVIFFVEAHPGLTHIPPEGLRVRVRVHEMGFANAAL